MKKFLKNIAFNLPEEIFSFYVLYPILLKGEITLYTGACHKRLQWNAFYPTVVKGGATLH